MCRFRKHVKKITIQVNEDLKKCMKNQQSLGNIAIGDNMGRVN